MSLSTLVDRVTDLERRVAAVEGRLGVATAPPPLPRWPAAPPPPPVTPVTPVAEAREAAITVLDLTHDIGRGAAPAEAKGPQVAEPRRPAPVRPVVQPAVRPAVRPASVVPTVVRSECVAGPAVVPVKAQPAAVAATLPYAKPAPVAPVPPPPPPVRLTSRDIEQALGLKLAGWVGAVVLVIGLAFGCKYAYDQHWFGLLPPAGRLSLMYVAAALLVGAGEWVYRKVNQLSAVGLYGAGVAALFLVSYAGHAYYGLYARDAAFVLMAASTLAGAAVALRGDLVSIAVLSIVGGNVVPLVLRGDSARLAPFLSYLLMLQGVALLLAGRNPKGKWWVLRTLSLGSTALWLEAVVMSRAADANAGTILAFAVVYAALYHAELIVSTFRRAGESRSQAAGGAVFAVAVTGGLLAAALALTTSRAAHGAWDLGLAAAIAVVGFGLLRTRARSLAPAYLVQAAALAVLSVPLVLTGLGVIVGWAVLGVTFAAATRVRPAPLSVAAALAAWALAVVKLTLWAMDPGSTAGAVWLSVAGAEVRASLATAVFLAASGHAIAMLTVRRGESPGDGLARLTGFAATALLTVFVLTTLPALPATVGLLLLAWVLAGADAVAPRDRFAVQSLAVLALGAAKWAVADLLSRRLAPGWSATATDPFVNPTMFVGLLTAASVAGIAVWRRRSVLELLDARTEAAAATVRGGVVLVVTALVTLGLSLQLDQVVERAVAGGRPLAWPAVQVKQMAWTILWALATAVAAYLVRGTRGHAKALGGLALLLAAKFAVVDTLAYAAGHEALAPPVLINLQTAAGVTVAAALYFASYLAGDDDEGRRFRGLLHAAAAFAVLWAGTFELDRLAPRLQAAGLLAAFPVWQLKNLLWTVWWSTPVAALLLARKVRGTDLPASDSWVQALLYALAAKYVAIDSAAFCFSDGVAPAWAVFNLQFLTGVLLTGLLVLARPPRFGTVAAAVVAFAGTVEADRVLRVVRDAGLLAMPLDHARQFAWTIWWAACLSGAAMLKRQVDPASPASKWPRVATAALALLAVKFVMVDALGMGLFYGVGKAMVVANLQCLTASVVLAAVALFHLRSPYPVESVCARARYATFASLLASVLVLVTGGLELNRFFVTTGRPLFANADLAEQVAFSIYFALFAIVLVSVGFRLRRAALRYVALGLYALTLVKVMLVDLAHVTTGYRILSCMGVGLLLLATSVLYGRVSPRLAKG